MARVAGFTGSGGRLQTESLAVFAGIRKLVTKWLQGLEPVRISVIKTALPR